MEPIHERIEDFLRRYGRVLAVAVGILLALLALRALRRISVVVVPALIGAVLVAWLILGSISAPDRAQTNTSVDTSVEWKDVRACGREFRIPASEAPRSFVRSMEIDCGIFGPKSSEDRRLYDGPY